MHKDVTLAKTDLEKFTARIVVMNDQLLEPNGLPKVASAKTYKSAPHKFLKSWCHINKLYGLPTLELIHWLEEQLAPFGDDTLEIGSGRGNLGRTLGIRQTDRFTCIEPEAQAYYLALQQGPPRPLDDVEMLDALIAVKKYNPRAVIASWVSQWVDPKDPNPPRGSIFGVKKEDLIAHPSVELYIQISNLNVHGHETVTRRAKISRPKWLASRGSPDKDVILTWKK